MKQPIAWHDLLALLCSDFLADSPFSVQAEVDLSLKKQNARPGHRPHQRRSSSQAVCPTAWRTWAGTT